MNFYVPLPNPSNFNHITARPPKNWGFAASNAPEPVDIEMPDAPPLKNAGVESDHDVIMGGTSDSEDPMGSWSDSDTSMGGMSDSDISVKSWSDSESSDAEASDPDSPKIARTGPEGSSKKRMAASETPVDADEPSADPDYVPSDDDADKSPSQPMGSRRQSKST
ncbi:uncharacterized protein BP01DRAFT_383065 [Aspergillus saccharolyticus JOP 1030-1]|uniref:Uncharacterized protein n=1 Tax=Aspergillus saccharolyticus JOP 1030-1 TaxID=1450539 RepID=A0A319AD94_9EURO|nr:hypothetical protein BP01DRAFT_383065 [Aspergillus saccharolyticus JOP 1030-1]PYH44832.1 hypothetical protein BP01DRAFT_383065 [Aspergillus saccharolyticus JOP 1030-1]